MDILQELVLAAPPVSAVGDRSSHLPWAET